MTTSQLAREKFEASGKKLKHHEVILWVLKTFGPASNYGIAKNAYYSAKDNNGNIREYKMSYYQVNKRTSELLRLKKIKLVDRIQDDDGATRNLYSIL